MIEEAAPVNTRKPLAELLHDLVEAAAVPALTTAGVELDSRRLRPGDLFLACRGHGGHGLAFAADAIRRGAGAIAYEPVPGLTPDPAVAAAGIPLIAVERLRERAGIVADRFYGMPSAALEVTGVTGTNGKTTVTWLLAGAARALGGRPAILGTLGAGRVDALTPGTLTTPDVVSVHRFLAQMRAEGADRVAMEVSSHALDQSRVSGVRFAAAVFTNLSRDHLDYHGNMLAYAAAKARLFTECAPRVAVINVGDARGLEIALRLREGVDLVSVGQQPKPRGLAHARHLLIESIAASERGLEIALGGDFGRGRMTLPLVGGFNAINAAQVVAVLLARGVSLAEACSALREVSAPPGRMQRLGGGPSRPAVVVDYAHTPDSLGKALRTLREHTAGRLFCVFGCGGDRDPGKRVLMGEVADRLADVVVVTDDNPRTEDPAAIVAQIVAGARHAGRLRVEHDRRRAIRLAIGEARPGDVVLVAGKGHEDYQLRGSERLPFSDCDEALAALAELHP